MAKPPPNIPEGRKGERVRLRASSTRHGTIAFEMCRRLWVNVIWDDGKLAPKICHQYELVALPIDGSEKTCV